MHRVCRSRSWRRESFGSAPLPVRVRRWIPSRPVLASGSTAPAASAVGKCGQRCQGSTKGVARLMIYGRSSRVASAFMRFLAGTLARSGPGLDGEDHAGQGSARGRPARVAGEREAHWLGSLGKWGRLRWLGHGAGRGTFLLIGG